MPWQFALSGTFQIYNGVRGQRTNLFRNIPSAGTVTLSMEPYGATAGPARSLVNLRLARKVDWLGKNRLRLSLEVLNVLNSATPWAMSFASGPTFGQYTSVDEPRVLRGGIVYSF